jgi:hypothetical protein
MLMSEVLKKIGKHNKRKFILFTTDKYVRLKKHQYDFEEHDVNDFLNNELGGQDVNNYRRY